KTLAARIKDEISCTLIRDEWDSLLRLFYVWSHFGLPNAPRRFLEKCLRTDANLAISYLRSAVGTAYSSDGSAGKPGRFDNDSYSAVCRYADPEKVLGALRKVFGDRLDSDQLDYGKVKDQNERMAREFAILHRLQISAGSRIKSDVTE